MIAIRSDTTAFLWDHPPSTMIEPLQLETSARIEKSFSPPGLFWGFSQLVLGAPSMRNSVVPDDCCVIGHSQFPAGVKSKESYAEQLAEAATMYENLY